MGWQFVQTDKQLFEIFQAAPWLLVELLQLNYRSNCRYVSMTVKAVARESDGVLVFDDPNEGCHIVEWQFYLDPTIYNRIATSMASLQMQFSQNPIEGTIVFSTRSLDPATMPWRSIIRAVYLDELLKELKHQQTSHPLLALFEPVLEDDVSKLALTLPRCYTEIDISSIPGPVKEVLQKIFMDWVMQRFPKFGKEEIAKMVLGQLTPLEQTRAAQELLADGESRGVVVGQIMCMQQLLDLNVSTIESLKSETIESLERTRQELQKQLKLQGN
jgi:hypothetical protein